MNIYNKYLIFAPFIYANIYGNYKIKLLINIPILCYFVSYYFDDILKLKLRIQNYFFKKSDFVLKKVLLYTNLTHSIDVTSNFKKNVKNEIHKNIILQIYTEKKITCNYSQDIRLKIFFTYKNNPYIIYFPYYQIYNKSSSTHIVPYPPYTDEILNNYRNDIIAPYHISYSKKKYLYSLFNMESKNIKSIKINDNECKILHNYFDMIKTPFYDYGILYNIPIKLRWALEENNIAMHTVQKFHLQFLNLYFDEENMELKEHNIIMNGNDHENILISDHMKNILLKKLIENKKI